ncbi:MAG: hypothetical protein JST82_04385 [Bacteroidetes bacterium]|nr:hypothetical protein [Bacteroidota bacterium]
MDYSISTNTMDDAEDLFIVAKEKLLDVNDWHCNYPFILNDSKKHKVHRNAHSGDFIQRTSTSDEWYVINKIQYDDYPDIAGESITIFLSNVNDNESMHTIAINRVGKVLNVQGHNLDFMGNADDFLKGLIAIDSYAIAS